MKAVTTIVNGTVLSIDPETNLAFNSDIVEKWNAQASKIDSRLFCFAYYEPRKWVSESMEAGFLRAVGNLYGLLFDCGNLPNALIKNKIKLNGRPFSENSLMDTICTNIASLRTCLFHNASTGINPLNLEHQNTFNNYTNKLRNEKDWELSLGKILKDAEELTRIIEKFLSQAAVLSTVAKKELIDKWIKQGILFSYQKLIYSYIFDAYKRRCNIERYIPPKRITSKTLSRWVELFVNNEDSMGKLEAFAQEKYFSTPWKLQDFQNYLLEVKMEPLADCYQYQLLPADFLGELLKPLSACGLPSH